MAKIQEKNNTIIIKTSIFTYVWLLLFYFGGLGGSLLLITEGFSFESKYSFKYIFGGIMFLPIFAYLTIWIIPALNPAKVLLKIIPGERVISKRATVPLKNIRDISLVRNPFNLINNIVIETFSDEKIKICTYNMIDDYSYEIIVDQYIYPHMTENARKVWDRKINLERLKEVTRYERKEQNID